MEDMVKPGETRSTKLPDSFDGIRYTLGRMVKMIQESRKDPLVIGTARKIAALSLPGRKIRKDHPREWWILKGIYGWCKDNFVYVDDPVGIELIQTPNRMLRELEIPPQLQTLMWKPIAKVMGGKMPRPKMTGDSDESATIALALAAAAGIGPLKLCLGGQAGTFYYVWGAAKINGKWLNIDILSEKFDTHPPFENLEDLEVPI